MADGQTKDDDRAELAKAYDRVHRLAKARDVDGLIAELGNPLESDPISFRGVETQVTVRGSAAFKLSQLRPASAIGPLIELLESDPNEHVRLAVARALGMIGSPKAVRPLIAALDDSDEGVRCWAATGLGDLGDRVAVRALVDHLADDRWSVRRTSAEALAKLGDPAAIRALTEAVQRESFRRRPAMSRALRLLRRRASGLVPPPTGEPSWSRAASWWLVRAVLFFAIFQGLAPFVIHVGSGWSRIGKGAIVAIVAASVRPWLRRRLIDRRHPPSSA